MKTERELAKELKISAGLVGRKRRQGKADEAIAAEAEARRLTSNANRRAETYSEAQTRKERALASLREVELAVKQGQVVSIEDAGAAWASQIANCRSRLLAIAAALAPGLAVETSAAQCQFLVKEAIYEALRELSAGPSENDLSAAEGCASQSKSSQEKSDG